ncbi:hypothetical protein [Candidatus Odyssella thessalonicensis]|uniref:hypothetical protein n=1 Tax=Candidatus Odyssella thessalonicensis TaxID=84647 RepID=UPI000225BDC7|nr:hypothetical protein [Candidatus Odyssella thessalonicensis]
MSEHSKHFYRILVLTFTFTHLALSMDSLEETEESKPLSGTNLLQSFTQVPFNIISWVSGFIKSAGPNVIEERLPQSVQESEVLSPATRREIKIDQLCTKIAWHRPWQPFETCRSVEELTHMLQPLSCEELEVIVENKKFLNVFRKLRTVSQEKTLTFLVKQSPLERIKIFSPLAVIIERLTRINAKNLDAWLDSLAAFNSFERISLIQSLAPLVNNYMEKEASGAVSYGTLIKLMDILLTLKAEERRSLTNQAAEFARAHHCKDIPFLLASIIPLEEPIRQTVCTFLAVAPIFGRCNFDQHPSLLEKLFSLIGSLPPELAETIGELTFSLFHSQLGWIEAAILVDCIEMLTLLSAHDLDELKRYNYYFREEDDKDDGASVKDFLCVFCEIEQDRRESVIREACRGIVLKWRPSNPITALRFLKDLPSSYRQFLLSNGKKADPGEKIGRLSLSCYNRIPVEERIEVFKDFCLFEDSHVFSSTLCPQYQILEEIALLPAHKRKFLLKYATDRGIKILKKAFKILKSTPEDELSKNPSLLFLNPFIGLPLSLEERLILSQSDLALKLEVMEGIPSQCFRQLSKSYFYKFLMRTSPQDCKLFEQYITELNLSEAEIIQFVSAFDKIPAPNRKDVLQYTASVMIFSGCDKSNPLKLMQLICDTLPEYRPLICDYGHWLLKEEFYPDIQACLKILADITHHKRELLLQEIHTLLTKDNNKAHTPARASVRLQEIAGLSDEESSHLFKEVNLK